jgi:hypothetical protein
MKLLQWNKFFKWFFLENLILAAQIAFFRRSDPRCITMAGGH